MRHHAMIRGEQTQILTRGDLARMLADGKRQADRSCILKGRSEPGYRYPIRRLPNV